MSILSAHMSQRQERVKEHVTLLTSSVRGKLTPVPGCANTQGFVISKQGAIRNQKTGKNY